ncbi:hypothetical protein PKHYL_15500 [Psychrobacter sp. KH172YL61]|uniref:hypothetical protein n=1 Tax=Psychrobacter sp. KH172YL61 TaxID=2517899 RepID=UPI0010B3A7F4|nr:hypothetical protein [Psychrobacter sp. KH172YL61]BBI67359.1 hypothetical protein PKHYL_15500 [Psychrobacter sp. KH172YL61]
MTIHTNHTSSASNTHSANSLSSTSSLAYGNCDVLIAQIAQAATTSISASVVCREQCVLAIVGDFYRIGGFVRMQWLGTIRARMDTPTQ